MIYTLVFVYFIVGCILDSYWNGGFGWSCGHDGWCSNISYWISQHVEPNGAAYWWFDGFFTNHGPHFVRNIIIVTCILHVIAMWRYLQATHPGGALGDHMEGAKIFRDNIR